MNNINNINNWKQEDTRIKDLYYWIYQKDLKSSFPFEETSVEFIADHALEGNDINLFDFNFISSIIQTIDTYFEIAINGIKEEINKDHTLFGITQKKTAEYLNMPAISFPVNQPSILFYRDGTWMIRFAEADFPTVDYGLGIGITFDRKKITDISILDSDEIIEEDIL